MTHAKNHLYGANAHNTMNVSEKRKLKRNFRPRAMSIFENTEGSITADNQTIDEVSRAQYQLANSTGEAFANDQ
jgi:hypothetical protein